MNNKVFISGKITGDPSYPWKFEAASLDVSRPQFFDRHGSSYLSEKCGYFGFRPVDPTTFTIQGIPLTLFSWSVCMIVCLWRLTWCSHVYFLRDWKDSRGARREHAWAKFLHKHIIYQIK